MDGKIKRYATPIDLSDSNQSWSRLIQWTGTGKRVLGVGCGRGQIGRILYEQFGCAVTGIEMNPEFARECVGYVRVIIGNAEDQELLSSCSERFDVIICGDVLEHMRKPEVPLRAFHQLITPGGRLLVSVPNVAQIRIRLMLLGGRWDYTSEGIMDETHLRWFTLETLRALMKQLGWQENDFDYIVGPNAIRFLRRFHVQKNWLPPTLLASQFLMNLSALD